jgi:hypothetical protein
MNRHLRFLTIAACLLTLAACGSSSDDDDTPPPASANPPTRGSLIQSPPARTASLSPATIAAALTNQPGAEYLLDLIVAPKCGIDVHHVQYNTVDPTGAATTASAAMMIPTGSDPVCQGPRPIVLYAHGTAAQRSLNLAAVTNEDNLEGLFAATVFTTQGYVLIAPNDTGYDTSALTYNPYLNADQESKDMVDALTAARSALPIDGDAQGAAGSGRSDHCVGADVRSVRGRCVLRCRVLRPGHAHDTSVPGLHVDGLSEGVWRRLRECGRCLRSALPDRH